MKEKQIEVALDAFNSLDILASRIIFFHRMANLSFSQTFSWLHSKVYYGMKIASNNQENTQLQTVDSTDRYHPSVLDSNLYCIFTVRFLLLRSN